MTDVEAEGVRVNFAAKKALDGVDLEAAMGNVHGLLGPDGVGKTTTARALATLLRLDAGQARSRIGVTGQQTSVDNTLTTAENLTLLGRLLGLVPVTVRAFRTAT